MSKSTPNGCMLIFRSTDWYKGLSAEEMQRVADHWTAWFKGLTESGKALAGHPLESEGKVVVGGGNGGRIVSDGPFAESKETIGGFFMLKVETLEEAVAIAEQCPGLPYGIRVEVRPVAAQCPALASAGVEGHDTAAGSGPKVVVVRQFEAPAEVVYDAWLDRATVGRWLFATTDGKMKRVEVNPIVGGKFEIFEQRGEKVAEHFGTYEKLERPGLLVFSFWTGEEKTTSRVTVKIEPTNEGCTLTLSHVLDPKWASMADRARQGWGGILNGLASICEPMEAHLTRA